MIYVDTSVALAHLLAEDRRPPTRLWKETLVSSRLLQYELWTRLNARDLAFSHREAALELEARISLLEMVPPVLERALSPIPETAPHPPAKGLAISQLLAQLRQTVACFLEMEIRVGLLNTFFSIVAPILVSSHNNRGCGRSENLLAVPERLWWS